jgi:hypothetical protein
MSELSPELQQLVHAGKIATRPSEADRQRVYRSLEARLGLAGGIAGATVAGFGSEGVRRVSLKVASFISAGVILVVGAGVLVYSSYPRADRYPAAPSVSTVAEPKADSTPTVSMQIPQVAPAQVATPLDETPTKNVTSRAAARPRDSLAEEVALLTRAEKELHAGRAQGALQLLNEHERRYKSGLLAEERTAARIQALCALGRVSDANALLGRLSPKSLHGEPARQACGAAKKPAAAK